MSLRLEMLQVARLAPKLLGESAPLVTAVLESQRHPSGGFVDRSGEPDLYYTVFGLEALTAMRADPGAEAAASYLLGFGDGGGLDFVHLACLGRAWANLQPPANADALLARLERYRTPDGGYNQAAGAPHGTAYAAFLAIGAYQDLQRDIPDRDSLIASVAALQAADGSFANLAGARTGVTTATAAAVMLMRQAGLPADPTLVSWLLARGHAGGGFFAVPGAPAPDLLSTATALHALAAAQSPLDDLREPCLDFVDSLWTNRGGFYGHWADDAVDTEYTYYGLLALGHLAV
ncbi:MAG: hypothetical protein IT162_09870 [Bryobacterales bacterium]|nr:hypothetical protein [Bryobacterales bacterium]